MTNVIILSCKGIPTFIIIGENTYFGFNPNHLLIQFGNKKASVNKSESSQLKQEMIVMIL